MSNRPRFIRILALVLLFSMLLGMLPVTAAGPGEDLQTIASSDALGSRANELLQQIIELDEPYNRLLPSGDTSATIPEGLYYAVHSTTDGEHIALSAEKEASLYRFGGTSATVEGTCVDTDPYAVLEIRQIGQTQNCSLRNAAGDYLGGISKDGSIRPNLARANNFYLGTDGTIRLQVSSALSLYLQYDGEGEFYYHIHQGQENEHVFSFYQVSVSSYLYRALHLLQEYLEEGAYRDYSPTVYEAFLDAVESALQNYNAQNNNLHWDLEAAVRNGAQELESQMGKLTLGNLNHTYIDIPVEILDFKADGLMFEGDQIFSTYKVSGYPHPGDREDYPNGNHARVGLVLDKLRNRQLLYTPELIAYVAHYVIEDQWYSRPETFPEGMNKIVFERIEQIRQLRDSSGEAAALGSWELTESKIGGNGNDLLWRDVETAFDLAYYVVTYLWRPVQEGDYQDAENQIAYSTAVPQRSHLRMYQDENGLYTLHSDYHLSYEGSVVFNTQPLRTETTPQGIALFRPVDGLGFETDWTETDCGSYFVTQGHPIENQKANYHFSMHAYGSFVYYEDQDLYFDFEGDDDVYFFINNELVLDLGGEHSPVGRALRLNDIQLSEPMVDGEIYNFDMFYAERHTLGSNLKFSTNMKIIDTEAMTTKGQYGVVMNEESMIDPITGMGKALDDYALVNVGDITAYSFSLTNLRQVPLEEISFLDEKLGTDLSPESVRLYDEELTGIDTDIGELSLYYSCLDENGKAVKTTPELISYDTLVGMIEAAKDGDGFEEPGYYRVTDLTDTQLRTLLRLGVPGRCHFTLYGIKRKTTTADTPYENTVQSVCYYYDRSSGETNADDVQKRIVGAAARILRVPDMDGISLPVVKPFQTVLDYGKAVKLPLEDLRAHIQVKDPVSLGDFLGLTSVKPAGNILKKAPSELFCTDTVGELAKGATSNGSYERTETDLIFRLTRMLSEKEKVYAAFELNGYSAMDGNRSVEYKCILLELCLIPANVMYYETDFAEGIFTREAVGAEASPWEPDKGTANLHEEYQNNGHNADSYPAQTLSLSEQKSAMRSNSTGASGYVLIDFEADDNSLWNTVNISGLEKDVNAGVLKGTITGVDPHVYMPYNPGSQLSYVIKQGDVVQLRMKTDPRSGDNRGIQVFLDTTDTPDYEGTHIQDQGLEHDTGSFEIIELEIPQHFWGKELENIRFDPLARVSGTDLSIQFELDYYYVGPKNSAPNQDYLLFDFGNTPVEQAHYATKTYGNKDFSDEANWSCNLANNSAEQIDSNAGTLTYQATRTAYHYVQAGTNMSNNYPLNYLPQRAEVLQVRLKLLNFSEANSDPFLSIVYYKDPESIPDANGKETNFYTTNNMPFDPTPVNIDQFFVLTFPLPEDFRAMEKITTIRLNICNLTCSTDAPGTVVLDYIYIGPENAVPTQDHLFFGFTDSTEDRERYNSKTYGYISDFDSAHWSGNQQAQFSTANGGFMSFAPTANQASIFQQTVKDASQDSLPLSYIPTGNEYVQIRYKLENLTAWENQTPMLRLYYIKDGQPITESSHIKLGDIPDRAYSGGFVTVTVPATVAFRTATIINAVRPQFFYLQGTGMIHLDYLYIGPWEELPTTPYEISYYSSEGTELFTETVHHGEPSLYPYELPEKASDANVHYSFSHWAEQNGNKPDLQVITGSLQLFPAFASEAHSWNAGVVTTPATCMTNGSKLFTCTVCSRTKTQTIYATGHDYVDDICTVCGVKNEGTLLHFKSGSPELGYAWDNRNLCSKPTFDTSGNGYMNGTITATGSSLDAIVGITPGYNKDNLLHKVYNDREIIQLRVKLTLDTDFSQTTYAVFLKTSDFSDKAGYGGAPYSGATTVSAHSYYISPPDDNGYVTVNVRMPLYAVGTTVETLRLDFFEGIGTKTFAGTYSVDYIYLGCGCTAPVPEHTLELVETISRPTCETEGKQKYRCILCGETEEVAVPCLPHVAVPIPPVEATCNSIGYRGGEKCGQCGTILTPPEVIPVMSSAHKYVYTDQADGTHVGTCSICTHTSTREDHSFFYGSCSYCGANEPDYMVYGYDSSYLDDHALSNGTSLFVKGAGVTLKDDKDHLSGTYTRATFSFTGTGFDLISRTGKEQASIRLTVYSQESMVQESAVKSLTVYNKGELELYQIPVASVHDLPYGTYYVAIGVNKAITYVPQPGKPDMSYLNRGDEFYFDAVRIYDPLKAETDEEALSVYETHGEAYPQITELRDLLLTADQFSVAGSNAAGAVFIDASGDNNGDHLTFSVATYKDYGPKNETYLYKDQAVSFKLLVRGKILPKSLDIGVKTIHGGTAVFCVGLGKAVPTANAVTAEMTKTQHSIHSATSLYYSLGLEAEDFQMDSNGDYYTYVVLTNTGAEGTENVLSVTDIKAAFHVDPMVEPARSASAGVSYVVDGETFRVAEAFLTGATAELPVDEGVSIRHSLDLASDISINYLVEKEELADYDHVYLECSLPKYSGTELTGYELQQIQAVEKGPYYYFTLTGLTAVQMNDEIHATLRMEKDGWSYSSPTDTYSIAAYAYSQLKKTGTAQKLKELCAELLRYGAMAQSFKGYRTDAPADAAMTEEQKALLKDLNAVSFGNSNRILEDCAEPAVVWVGKSLSLDSKVAVNYIIDLSDYRETEPLSLRISYRDRNGTEHREIIRTLKPYGDGTGYYVFSFDGLLAAELRTELTAAVYAGETQVSHSLLYSPDTYGRGKTGTLGQLCRALLSYSDSALSFFQA